MNISPRLFTRIAQSFDISQSDLNNALDESADGADYDSSQGQDLLLQYVESLYTQGRMANAAAMAVQFAVPRDTAEKVGDTVWPPSAWGEKEDARTHAHTHARERKKALFRVRLFKVFEAG